MDEVGAIAVVGTCGPERLRYAKRLAELTGRALFRASRLSGSYDTAKDAAELALWAHPAVGAVMEIPDDVPAPDLIGAFSDQARVHLDRLICVADATHVLDDFQRDDYLAVRDAEAGPKPTMTARALLMAMQFEYASTIIFVGWESLTTPELTTVMALVSHLSPRARLWLDRRTIEHVGATDPTTPSAFRPGWVGVLNDEFDPHMTDRRVSAFRYEQVRPLHPARLMALLDRVEAGEFGNVVRSAGFCRLATRPHITAQWEHVGRMISLEPLTSDERLVEGEELLAVGQDIAFIGIDVDQDALAAALDDVALTDDELAEGPAAWAGFEDPFPVWQTASDWAD